MTALTLEDGTKIFARQYDRNDRATREYDDKNLVHILSYECGEPITFSELQEAIETHHDISINSNHIENRDTDQRTIMTVKNARKFGILLEFEEE